MYQPELDGSAEDAARGFRTLADVTSPRLLRPVRTEADARAVLIRSRLLSAVNALYAAGAIEREIVGELVAAIEGATS